MIIKDLDKLHEICTEADKSEASDILNMLEKELDTSNKNGVLGIGLAAPQIGIQKKVAIIRIDDIKLDLVNCKIIKKYKEVQSFEGCLSVPGKGCKVNRWEQIVVGDNELGNFAKFSAYGMPSVCVQHEMDHWDGILMVDKEIKVINLGDNQPCYCGSGKKFKKCCKKAK